jgi:hypothetical protein
MVSHAKQHWYACELFPLSHVIYTYVSKATAPEEESSRFRNLVCVNKVKQWKQFKKHISVDSQIYLKNRKYLHL